MERSSSRPPERARFRLALTFPRDAWWTRLAVRVQNVWFGLRGLEFRAYVHRPEGLLAAAERRGLTIEHEHLGAVWQLAVLARAP
jgi:hypothetical protein